MQPYMATVKLHKDLGKYNIPINGNEEKEVDRIIAMHNGRIVNPEDEEQYTGKEAAKLCLNTLMRASESVRINGRAGKHYGVGFQELETAAELGIYLMRQCGIDDGRKMLKDIIKAHYTRGIPFTQENVRKTLGLIDLCENGPPVSHDHYVHDGRMEH